MLFRNCASEFCFCWVIYSIFNIFVGHTESKRERVKIHRQHLRQITTTLINFTFRSVFAMPERNDKSTGPTRTLCVCVCCVMYAGACVCVRIVPVYVCVCVFCYPCVCVECQCQHCKIKSIAPNTIKRNTTQIMVNQILFIPCSVLSTISAWQHFTFSSCEQMHLHTIKVARKIFSISQ